MGENTAMILISYISNFIISYNFIDYGNAYSKQDKREQIKLHAKRDN